MLPDHVHVLISITPKHAVSQVVGFLKGKSAIHIARNFGRRRRNFTGQHFWARGYYVSTVGKDEQAVRKYVLERAVTTVAEAMCLDSQCSIFRVNCLLYWR